MDELLEGEGAELSAVFSGAEIEAEIVRSLLEENDIPAVKFGSGTQVEGAVDLRGHRVMVHTKDRGRAEELIADAVSDQAFDTVFDDSEQDDDEDEDGFSFEEDDGSDPLEEEDEYGDTGGAADEAADVQIIAAPRRGPWLSAIVALVLLGLGIWFYLQQAP